MIGIIHITNHLLETYINNIDYLNKVIWTLFLYPFPEVINKKLKSKLFSSTIVELSYRSKLFLPLNLDI